MVIIASLLEKEYILLLFFIFITAAWIHQIDIRQANISRVALSMLIIETFSMDIIKIGFYLIEIEYLINYIHTLTYPEKHFKTIQNLNHHMQDNAMHFGGEVSSRN